MTVIHNLKCLECGKECQSTTKCERCIDCVTKLCTYSEEVDSYNRVKCNHFGVFRTRGMFNCCIGHWKQKYHNLCYGCGRRCHDKGYDGFSYCKRHLPDHSHVLSIMIKNIDLPPDILKCEIYDKLVK
jgi:hypothetical protein